MSAQKPLPSQTVVQINIYRLKGAQYEFLLLKRIDEHDDEFWQVITEPVASHATIADTLKEASETQIGVRGFKHLSNEMYSYEWYAHGQRGRDIVFAAEVSPTTEIYPDASRYNGYTWLPAQGAMQKLKWSGNREAVRRLKAHLDAELLEHPLAPTTGLYSNNIPQQQQPNANAQNGQAPPTNNGPYGPDVPKRLPNVPNSMDDGRLPDTDEDRQNTSVFPL